jgi:N-acyl-D-aspartate/D-glutamate deacylase
MSSFDLVIRNGSIVDGTGAAPFKADIGVQNGRIAAIGSGLAAGTEEIDATGQIVTPGFVDIHTHYDGQVTWEDRLTPSSFHGVTTAVIGNCGVGFAPCREADRDVLVRLMEGVEDIPYPVLTEGLPWTWTSFPEFLDLIASKTYDMDIAAYVPHAALRVYVMGQRRAWSMTIPAFRNTPEDRTAGLIAWEQAPMARAAHPREDHLIPLMTVVGAAEEDAAATVYHQSDLFGGVTASSFRLGALPQ